MKNPALKLHVITDTTGVAHLINPAQITEIRPQGGTIGSEHVVEVCLSDGRSICATGFGSGEFSSCTNCAEYLDLVIAQ